MHGVPNSYYLKQQLSDKDFITVLSRGLHLHLQGKVQELPMRVFILVLTFLCFVSIKGILLILEDINNIQLHLIIVRMYVILLLYIQMYAPILLLQHDKFYRIFKGGTLKLPKQEENLDSNLQDDTMENEMKESNDDNEEDDDMADDDDDITKGGHAACEITFHNL